MSRSHIPLGSQIRNLDPVAVQQIKERNDEAGKFLTEHPRPNHLDNRPYETVISDIERATSENRAKDYAEGRLSPPADIDESTTAVSGLKKFFTREGRSQHRIEKAKKYEHRNSVIRAVAESIDQFTDDGKRAKTHSKEGVSATTPEERWNELQMAQFGEAKYRRPEASKFTVSIWKDHWALPDKKRRPDVTGPNLYRPTTKSEIKAAASLTEIERKKDILFLRKEHLKASSTPKRAMSQLSKPERKLQNRLERGTAKIQKKIDRKQKKFEKISSGNDLRGRIYTQRAKRNRNLAQKK
jgi:hypothetical protein